MNLLNLNGKVALVTGGTRGIGLAIVKAYLAHGAQVAFTGRTQESLDAACKQLDSTSGCKPIVAYLSEISAPSDVVAATVQEFGRLDILVNNAGVLGPNNMWETEAHDWEYVHAVNIRAPFMCSREAAKAMQASQRGGSIINVSSVAAQIGGAATGPAYVSSKSALLGLTRSLARQLADKKIRVNCIAPADIETDMVSALPEDMKQRLIGMTPLSRFGTPEEVANVALFLGSDAASYMTGQTISVNGGLYMG